MREQDEQEDTVTRLNKARGAKKRKRKAKGGLWVHPDAVITLADFRCYMQQPDAYIFLETGETWPGRNVNARVPPVPLVDTSGAPVLDEDGKQVEIPASSWLAMHRPVEQMTWCPGEPRLITDRLVIDSGWIERAGMTVFNLYRPPDIELGDPTQVKMWLDLLHKLYPDDADDMLRWWASRVQHPEVKINYALVMGGKPGIGKDSLLAPVKKTIGDWSFGEISPIALLKQYNPWVRNVILRISEARDMGEVNRYSLFEHTKTLLAEPPDVIPCVDKYIREHKVFNCVGVIFTTNYRDGLYLPEDDRRHYVAWSEGAQADFEDGYWNKLWRWYRAGGFNNVAAYLHSYDLSEFDPKAPPRKTEAFWTMVEADAQPEDTELAEVLEQIERDEKQDGRKLDAVIIADIIARGPEPLGWWLQDKKNHRKVPHRMERAGFVPVRNKDAKDGLWKVSGRRCVVYVKTELRLAARLEAVTAKVAQGAMKPDLGDVKAAQADLDLEGAGQRDR